MDAQDFPFSDVHVDSVDLIAGRAFTFSESAALNSGITKEYLFTTPATKDFYLTVSVIGILKVTLDMYEATARAGTNLKTSLNRNRHTATATTAIVHEGVGAGADGTLLFSEFSGTAALAGVVVNTGKWKLAHSTKYLIRITSGADGNTETVLLRWSEV